MSLTSIFSHQEPPQVVYDAAKDDAFQKFVVDADRLREVFKASGRFQKGRWPIGRSSFFAAGLGTNETLFSQKRIKQVQEIFTAAASGGAPLPTPKMAAHDTGIGFITEGDNAMYALDRGIKQIPVLVPKHQVSAFQTTIGLGHLRAA